MVVFTCDGCNETLKKAKVDQHALRCRVCESVSCVDCNVSFYGDDYRQHTSCVTEAERYEKSIYKGPRHQDTKDPSKKKQTPQEAWMDLLQSSISTAPSPLQTHLKRLVQVDNVPRKEKQFKNFVQNSMPPRERNRGVVEQMWLHLCKVRDEEKKRKSGENGDDARKKKNDAKGAELPQTNGTIPPNEAASAKLVNEAADKNISVEGTDNKASSDRTGDANKDEITQTTPPDIFTIKPSIVSKEMKKLLKQAAGQRMKRKAVQRELLSKFRIKEKGKGKKELKRLVEEQLAEKGKRFRLEGKEIVLVSKK